MASSDVQVRLRVLAPVEPGLSSLKLRDEGGSISATEGRTLHEQTPRASSPFWEGGVPWRRASQCDRQALAYRSSSPPDLPELRSHVAGPTGYSGERSGVRVFCPPGESRGNLCYVAHLSLAQFSLHPVIAAICSSNPKGITEVSRSFLGISHASDHAGRAVAAAAPTIMC